MDPLSVVQRLGNGHFLDDLHAALVATAEEVVAAGKPGTVTVTFRVRASVDDSAHLTLRFSIPSAERTLEDVYADRVKAARELLGEAFPILRAAD